MSRSIKVEIEVTKKHEVTLRKRENDSLAWDWYTDDDVESSGYYATMEDAIDNAERALSA